MVTAINAAYRLAGEELLPSTDLGGVKGGIKAGEVELGSEFKELVGEGCSLKRHSGVVAVWGS